jgi:hypothetical protein
MFTAARLTAVGIMLCAALLFGAPLAEAGQEIKFKVVSHITKVHIQHVADAENHIMGIYEHKGVALFADGKAASFEDQGSFDMYEPDGSHIGYVKLSFNDGSSIIFKYQGEEYRKDGSDLPFIKGKGSFMSGTGRYKGIKGSLTYDGGYITPYDEKTKSVGDSVVEYEGTYTLGK